jgi:hypothetical protein
MIVGSPFFSGGSELLFMIRPASSSRHHSHRSGRAILFLNGQAVGMVDTKARDTSWYFADFSPNAAFSQYAPIYGAWSLLMHAEGDDGRLSREHAEELSRAEAMLDRIKAQLVFVEDQQRVDVAQLTIDQDQLEWKEY